jgi:hypothetical protein
MRLLGGARGSNLGPGSLIQPDHFTQEYTIMKEFPILARVAQALLATTIVVAINAALAGAFMLQAAA